MHRRCGPRPFYLFIYLSRFTGKRSQKQYALVMSQSGAARGVAESRRGNGRIASMRGRVQKSQLVGYREPRKWGRSPAAAEEARATGQCRQPFQSRVHSLVSLSVRSLLPRNSSASSFRKFIPNRARSMGVG